MTTHDVTTLSLLGDSDLTVADADAETEPPRVVWRLWGALGSVETLGCPGVP
jgi:hypothetical protein